MPHAALATRYVFAPPHCSNATAALTFTADMSGRITRLQPYLFILPAVAIFATFVLYPMLATFALGLFSWKAMSEHRQWVGLANYLELFKDPIFYTCLKNNALWIALSLSVQLPLALLLAVALNAAAARIRLLRTAFFTPFVLPVVAVALIWWLIYEPSFGLANALLTCLGRLLGRLGMPTAQGSSRLTIAWLGNPSIATLSIIAVASWRYLGFHTVVLLAGLQSIDEDYYDAARIDGASGWQTFRFITLPLLSRIIAVDALLIVVGSVKIFDLIWVMTTGGPYHSTEVLATYMYYCGFTIDRMGYSAAIATIMVVLTMLAMLAYIRLGRISAEE